MSKASRKLPVGARVTTDYSRKITEHTIIERNNDDEGASFILFRVAPIAPGSTGDWINADWFEPVGAKEKE